MAPCQLPLYFFHPFRAKFFALSGLTVSKISPCMFWSSFYLLFSFLVSTDILVTNDLHIAKLNRKFPGGILLDLLVVVDRVNYFFILARLHSYLAYRKQQILVFHLPFNWYSTWSFASFLPIVYFRDIQKLQSYFLEHLFFKINFHLYP